jgi:hypothetical protein
VVPEGQEAEAASPMDAIIAASEAQRDVAVASYGSSSGGLASADASTPALRASIGFASGANESSDETKHRDAASLLAQGFFGAAADQIDRAIALTAGKTPNQLGAQAESGKSQIAASIEAQKSTISASIDRARGEARVQAAMARRAVTSQAASFITGAEAQTANAIATVTGALVQSMGQVGVHETTNLDNVNEIYSQGRTTLSALGTKVGDECTAIGAQFSGIYKGFENCTENGFFDGDLSGRRARAQMEASTQTAKGYHNRMVDEARKQAHDITKSGRKQNRCAVIAAARNGRDTLDQQFAALTHALEAAREGAIEQAQSMRDGLLASIDASLAATLRQLDHLEHNQRQTADDTGYLQQVIQEQLAHAGAASLQRAVTDAAGTLQNTLAELQARFSSSPPPDLEKLDGALATVSQNIDSAMNGLTAALDGGTTGVAEHLGGAATAGMAALDGVTISASEVITQLSAGFTTSMGAIYGVDNFAMQRTGFGRQIQKAGSDGSAALGKVVTGFEEGCKAIKADSRKSLVTAGTEIEQNLRQSKQGIECQITKAADDAASKEPPAWKKVVAVLLVILVIVIVIAVTVLTAGMALGPLAMIGAGILIGAAVGAATSALLALAGNLWSNRPTWQGVGKAALRGAISGAIGGGIGAGVGAAFQGASIAVQYGAAMVTAGVLNVGEQYIEGGLSFHNFSWTQLGITFLTTALTLGIAHYGPQIKTRIAGFRRAGGAHPGVEPVPTSGEAVPAAGERAAPTETAPPEATPSKPTEATPAEPAPTEPIPPKPAEAAPPEPAPSKPAEPTPTEPAPTEPKPPEPSPAEAKATEPTPAEPAAPETAEPTAVEPTPAEKATTEEPMPSKTAEEPATQEPAVGEKEPASSTGKAEPLEKPWETEKGKRRYQRYRNNLNRRNIKNAKLGKETKEPLEPSEWWAEHGRKTPASPEGGKGDPNHQNTVKDLFAETQGQYKPPKYTVVSEQPLPPKYKMKSGVKREPDVYVIDNDTGDVILIREAARFNKSGGLLRSSEKAKIPDYDAAGIPYEFYPVKVPGTMPTTGVIQSGPKTPAP